MTIFGTRWTAREWTDRLGARLARAPQVVRLHVDAPLRFSLWNEGRGPYRVNTTRAYEAYQRADAGDAALLDATATAIIASLARLDVPPTWEDARSSVVPWLLPPDHAAGRVTAGAFGDLAIAFRFITPISGIAAFVEPPAWGVDPETLLHRSLANLAQTHGTPLFRPLPDAPAIFRLVTTCSMAASHMLLPEVHRAIYARCGSRAFVLVAAPDAVFVSAPNVLGKPPAALRAAAEIRAALTGADALSETPVLVHDGQLASR